MQGNGPGYDSHCLQVLVEMAAGVLEPFETGKQGKHRNLWNHVPDCKHWLPAMHLGMQLRSKQDTIEALVSACNGYDDGKSQLDMT